MKLDEFVTDQSMAERLTQDTITDVACVKMARVGGLTKARRICDYFVDYGIKVVTECMMGGRDRICGRVAFCSFIPHELLFNTTDLHAYNTESTGTPAPPTSEGLLYCRDKPGLGVEPDFESFGDPVAVYE